MLTSFYAAHAAAIPIDVTAGAVIAAATFGLYRLNLAETVDRALAGPEQHPAVTLDLDLSDIDWSFPIHKYAPAPRERPGAMTRGEDSDEPHCG